MTKYFPYDLPREERRAYNARLLELARHNGYPIEVERAPRCKLWFVPEHLVEVAGNVLVDLPA